MEEGLEAREAVFIMVAMMIILFMILLFGCIIPCYNNHKRRSEELNSWWERDPRWLGDKFLFASVFPNDYRQDKKFSAMHQWSRSPSERSRETVISFVAPRDEAEVIWEADEKFVMNNNKDEDLCQDELLVVVKEENVKERHQ